MIPGVASSELCKLLMHSIVYLREENWWGKIHSPAIAFIELKVIRSLCFCDQIVDHCKMVRE